MIEQVFSYNDAAEILNGRSHVRIGFRTTLEKEEPSNYIIRYINTPIVTFRPDRTIVLFTDGYWTNTTKQRLNIFGGFTIYSQGDGSWAVIGPDKDSCSWYDGPLFYNPNNPNGGFQDYKAARFARNR